MAGGTLMGVSITNGTLTNNATFDGYGTINAGSGGFSNFGTMTLTAAPATVTGDYHQPGRGLPQYHE